LSSSSDFAAGCHQVQLKLENNLGPGRSCRALALPSLGISQFQLLVAKDLEILRSVGYIVGIHCCCRRSRLKCRLLLSLGVKLVMMEEDGWL
jgi:hypothetical protein